MTTSIVTKLISSFWHLVKAVLEWIVFRLLRLNIAPEKWNAFLQFVKFGIVGVSNTIISYVIYVISLLVMQRAGLWPKADYLVAQSISFFLSVLWSFYWNRRYVFKASTDRVPWPQALLKSYISYAFTGLFLNSVLSIFWVQVIHMSKLVAPIANLLLSVPVNFFLNKLWAFREKT